MPLAVLIMVADENDVYLSCYNKVREAMRWGIWNTYRVNNVLFLIVLGWLWGRYIDSSIFSNFLRPINVHGGEQQSKDINRIR